MSIPRYKNSFNLNILTKITRAELLLEKGLTSIVIGGFFFSIIFYSNLWALFALEN